VVGALAFIVALTGEISADVRFGLHVSVEADGGGDLGVHPGVRVVGRVDGVSVTGPGSSQTPSAQKSMTGVARCAYRTVEGHYSGARRRPGGRLDTRQKLLR
jgi:hypothetical protein